MLSIEVILTNFFFKSFLSNNEERLCEQRKHHAIMKFKEFDFNWATNLNVKMRFPLKMVPVKLMLLNIPINLT